MTAQSEGKIRLVPATPGEALGLQLGARAAAYAGHMLRVGGYHPTPAQIARISRELALEALAAGVALADAVAGGMTPPSDDDLDEVADRSGAAKVVEVCGPPAMVN